MKDTLIGTLLGDGSLAKHGRGYRFTVSHKERMKPYLEWKREELLPLHPGNPHWSLNGGYPYWRFVTRIHPDLDQLRQVFYPKGKKVVPKGISQLLTSRKALAVLVMDDGHCDQANGAMLLNTQCFSQEDVERLQRCLKVNFGLATRLHSHGRGRGGKRVYFPVAEAHRLTEMIEPFVLPEMRYKLSYPRND